MSTIIKVAIADDHGLLRQGLISLIQKMEGIVVIGEVSSGEEAVNFAAAHNPDVFLIDIVMGGMSGIEATRWIKEQNREIKVILISSEVKGSFVTEGIQAGIDGYLNKNTDQPTLFNAIKAVYKGDRYFSPEITAIAFQTTHRKDISSFESQTVFSKQERKILKLLAKGKRMDEISNELFMTTQTTQLYIADLLNRLNLSDVAQLAQYGVDHHFNQNKPPE
jgi:two-component system response regulator NreC